MLYRFLTAYLQKISVLVRSNVCTSRLVNTHMYLIDNSNRVSLDPLTTCISSWLKWIPTFQRLVSWDLNAENLQSYYLSIHICQRHLMPSHIGTENFPECLPNVGRHSFKTETSILHSRFRCGGMSPTGKRLLTHFSVDMTTPPPDH